MTKNIRTFEEHTPEIAATAWVDESAVIIGNSHIGEFSSVWPHVTIRGDIHQIRIGEYTNIQDNSVLHITHDSQFLPGGAPLSIGDRVTVGHSVILHGCTLEDECLIGMGSHVLDKAHIETGVMVGAGSLVPMGKRLESGYLYVGSPVKQIRPLKDSEKAFLSYSAKQYHKLAMRHLNHSQPV